MPIAPPPAIEPAPTVPSSASAEETFDAAYEAFNTWEKNELQPKLAPLAANVFANASETVDATEAAVAAAVSASTAASQAVAAANFKGLWPSMTGPLNKPACVKHNGRFWMLLNNLADVTTSQPGVSADWTALNVGQVSARISANTNAVAGVFYIATTPGITLTYAGGSWTADDATGGRNASGGSCFINWGAYTVSGETPEAPMSWPNRGRFNAVYDGSTFA
ncbi:hypothetical protein J2W88_003015 [Acidovorax delafieldii]|uniref:Uncharacterized protein n=1 Tax=Acidovorax delafieldii TaxID=47920 RepID=A0AAJ2BSY2_ACIDE|nr:hypothetical protein [Acidovorax delafieldii]MDR6767734.1 hypothetical protein [Acidovorax delafieldii]MDR6839716.1 hypothetical protein [Acidovorax delafieldii]MDR7368383.1 hypothetical protein [Acidovorax delafieldii]